MTAARAMQILKFLSEVEIQVSSDFYSSHPLSFYMYRNVAHATSIIYSTTYLKKSKMLGIY
jgi:hypothetical protein